jgi:hypothetical protein
MIEVPSQVLRAAGRYKQAIDDALEFLLQLATC